MGAALYYGSYLPFQKSRIFISAFRNIQRVESVETFRETFDSVLRFPSPVGQNEEIRFLSQQVVELISKKPAEEASRALMSYLESYLTPIIRKQTILNYTQNFIILGGLYHAAWVNYGKQEDLEKAIAYYSRGLEASPRRPQFLYNLFDLYRASGNIGEAKKIGEQILTFWPQDQKTKEELRRIDSGHPPAIE